jgi:phosphoglucosamine mutase
MNKKKRANLFGTDGIRSLYGTFPLDEGSIVKLGNVIGHTFPGSNIVIGRDTRESGEKIVQLLASGFSENGKIVDFGVIPTPVLSYITDKGNYDYGIMVTASHNPWHDNGIKIFKGDGEKITQEIEQYLEQQFYQKDRVNVSYSSIGGSEGGSQISYKQFLKEAVKGLDKTLVKNFKVILDCANGATYKLAPEIFQEIGFDTTALFNTPNGKNINQNCGSTHPQFLREKVMERGADLGITFDGDGDRVLMVDKNGNMLTGDHILYLISKFLLSFHQKFNRVVIGTVLGNLGLEKALNRMGVEFVRADVGDKYVYREMKKQGSILGGEQSGHTILREFQKSGDAILTALYAIQALFFLNMKPGDLYYQLKLYPQVIKNLTIREKRDLNNWSELQELIKEFSSRYGDNSRILIRYSGTEPKIRIMMESEQESIISQNIDRFEEFINSTIGE